MFRGDADSDVPCTEAEQASAALVQDLDLDFVQFHAELV
jgi:hypothetical protein